MLGKPVGNDFYMPGWTDYKKRVYYNTYDVTALVRPGANALGAGSILAAACDMALAAQSAKLGHPEIRGGVFNTVATALLPRLVGMVRLRGADYPPRLPTTPGGHQASVTMSIHGLQHAGPRSTGNRLHPTRPL